MATGTITKVLGPLVIAEGMAEAKLYDMVRVAHSRLIGEIIEMRGDRASIQVYEETSGIGPGEPVVSEQEPLCVELGPGLLGTMCDGIQRPLKGMEDAIGQYLLRGVSLPALSREQQWAFEAVLSVGTQVSAGDILGHVEESGGFVHKIMVPPGVSGTLCALASGTYHVTDEIGWVRLENGREQALTLMQKWPVREGRPYQKKYMPSAPLITGQRVLDSFFPVAKGGTACIPGPFGSGKTVVQHQLAKWSDCDVVVYIGCGERGNEMADVLREFPEIIDPRSGASIMQKTLLIANTSNMPVAAREASIYTGITVAEYFRDMGYSVALMADSTSRWAEALRELSGRLEEMPAEEGFPAYLASRLAEFYERAGVGETLSGREGSVTVIGAVSPQGGDFSEPVTENTRRFVRVFWALDRSLAYSRHFPAIHWMSSYSAYDEALAPYFAQEVGADFLPLRRQALALLQKEASLLEIVKLIGSDLLPEEQKLILETARTLRLGFLQQNAFHAVDTFVPLSKQHHMLAAILHLHARVKQRLTEGIPLQSLTETDIFETLTRMKYDIGNDDTAAFARLHEQIEEVTSRAY